MKRIFNFSKFARPASAFLLTALVLLLSFAGSSPQLHKLIHADADAPDHNCAITLFAHGQIAAADISVVVISLIALVACVALLAETFLLPTADYRYSASRAPPVS